MAEGADLELPTDEQIDQMKFGKLARLLQDLGMAEEETDDLNVKGARAEMKRRIKKIQATAATRRSAGQAAKNMKEVLKKHNSKQKRLKDICHSITAYLPNLNDSIKKQLKTRFDHEAEDILKDVQSHLDKEECCLLVAGETSSGKSTFLNLLLGDKVLPEDFESSTSTICEVKYGEAKQAVVHLRQPNGQGERQITIPLDGTEEHLIQKKLESYIHLKGTSRDTPPPAEKIEIFWPLDLLEGGIVLVDSPGVGESEIMDKVVADYIPKAFAFLYIIDSSRAGGVQQDRLGKLLKLYRTKGNAEDFDPESAMFICNKWDTVPAKSQDTLKTNTFSKLSAMWPGLKEEQVFYVSTRKAVKLGGILSADFTKVLDGLDLLLPKSLDIKLETQYRSLTRLLSEALTHIDVLLNFARLHLDEDTKKKKYEEVKKLLQLFDDIETEAFKDFESIVGNNVKTKKSDLLLVVENGTLKKQMMSAQKLPVVVSWWIPSNKRVRHQDILVKLVHEKRGEDFSKLKDLFEALANTLAQCPGFKGRVSNWENIPGPGLSFNDKLKEVADLLEKAQQKTLASITGKSSPVPHMEVKLDPLFKTPFLDTMYDAFLEGLTLSSLHWPGRWSRSIEYLFNWEAQSSTEAILHDCWDQAQASTPLIDILMEALDSEDLRIELAERQMQPQRHLMAVLEADITKMKTIVKQTIDNTFQDARSNEDILKIYEPQRDKINRFLDLLAMFNLTKMKKYDYDLDTTNWIGAGAYGNVFRVQVQWKGEEISAALKTGFKTDEFITAKTAWGILKEEDSLRNLKGDHIVEYYGTACKWVKTEGQPDRLRVGLVMELCEGTLESRIIGQRAHNPAWWGDDPEKQAAAFSYTQNLAVQLCEGLKHIHDAGYIHRDLKLRNILVTRDNTVKLADFGLTKRKEDITGTMAGTATYAAPEVKEYKVYDQSADIYSLGLILWEMWYGDPLYGLDDSAYSKEMKERLKEGKDIRMPKWEGSVEPIPEWTSLIHHCLRKDPSERPEIQECLDRIESLKFLCTHK